MITKKEGNKMYISGTIKDRAIAYYKPNIIDFHSEGIETSKVTMSYKGELTLKRKTGLERRLIQRQEELIEKEINKTQALSNLKYPEINKEVLNTLKLIFRTDRQFSFALFEYFYRLVILSSTKEELLNRITSLKELIDNLEKDTTQIDLELLIYLFLKEKQDISLSQAKEQKLHIIESEILSDKLEEIITFGEFISPKRVPIIANTLSTDLEASLLVAPLYFAIPSEQNASNFLYYCKNRELTKQQVKSNSTPLRIPTNLQKLIR